jgi:hypothetical protein
MADINTAPALRVTPAGAKRHDAREAGGRMKPSEAIERARAVWPRRPRGEFPGSVADAARVARAEPLADDEVAREDQVWLAGAAARGARGDAGGVVMSAAWRAEPAGLP